MLQTNQLFDFLKSMTMIPANTCKAFNVFF